MAICALCGHEIDSVSHIMEQFVIDAIKKDHPDWKQQDGSCSKCIEYYKRLDNPADAQALTNDND